jgi:quercetin dioxygenase-like cupin family protein
MFQNGRGSSGRLTSKQSSFCFPSRGRNRTSSVDSASRKPNHTVKNVENVLAGPTIQARVFTLAPGDSIPWHYHREITDHYFVLRGTLTVKTRDSADEYQLETGKHHRIAPGTSHHLSNRGAADCRFGFCREKANMIGSKTKQCRQVTNSASGPPFFLRQRHHWP